MRPIKLTMSAFGPYADKTILDMNDLGQKGIYLVAGDTGAGKTTIFDAICYALYGEASGSIRSADLFRSKYAQENVPTYVELEFLYRDEIYVVRRNPEYMRPAKKGEARLVPEDAKAILTLPDGTVISKINEVTEKITETLGLDKEQFRQIAMIAQGDFLRLIMARTDERSKIFREIFKTKRYQDLQEKLRENSGKLGRKYDELSKGIAQYITGIKIEETDPNYEELFDIVKKSSKSSSISSVSNVLDKLEQINCLDGNKLKDVEKDIKQYNKELEELGKTIEKVKQLIKLEADIKEFNTLAEEEKKKLEELHQLYKEQEGNISRREELAIEIAREEEKLVQIIKYNELINNKLRIEQLIIKEREDKDKYSKELQKNEVQVKEISELLKSYNEKAFREELEAISEEKNKINESVLKLNSIKSKHKEYVSVISKYEIALKDYTQVKSAYNEINNTYMNAENKFFDEQAGIIASKLEDNKPCPVCGSTIHPQKAVLSEESITKEILDRLKKDKEQKEAEYNRYSQEAGLIKGSLINVRSLLIEESITNLNISLEDGVINIEDSINLVENSKELAEKIYSHIQNKDKEIKASVEKVKKQDEEFKQKEEERKQKEELLSKCQEQVSNIKESITRIDEKLIKEQANLENITNNIEEVKTGLYNTNLEEEKNLYKQKKDEKDRLDKAYEEAKKNYEQAKTKCDNLDGRINALTAQLKTSEKVDISLEELLENNEHYKGLLKKTHDIKERLLIKKEANELTYKNIKSKHLEIEDVETQWNMVKALSNTANGKVSNKNRILLETYVQMAYFDRIIVKANTRFMKMSAGQYELVRKDDVTNKQSQSGLELDVIDHYNGTKRSVKSLSGGEAFKASLSLALGLSDEIQSMAGGIQLDTMFIDEGFGSLDEESLDNAIKTLYDLGKGNRLIGIISHVNELKTRIDKQIVVTKDKFGSKAEIVA
ncbi:MAG: SMC family ATPase [Lachnospiraceae bacterium]|nr:SMC family ATPase [Lachnospiraceae bacterium]